MRYSSIKIQASGHCKFSKFPLFHLATYTYVPKYINHDVLVYLYSNNGETKWEPCHYYDLDYTSLASISNFEEARAEVNYSNVTTKQCTKWNYDKSIFVSTTVTDVIIESLITSTSNFIVEYQKILRKLPRWVNCHWEIFLNGTCIILFLVWPGLWATVLSCDYSGNLHGRNLCQFLNCRMPVWQVSITRYIWLKV